MQILHLDSQREYACKRYEHVFSDTQRARRLIREMTILKQMTHPCCNKLLCVISPGKINNITTTPIEELKFNEVYLVLRKCDMDLKKLIKSGKHLDELQVKGIVYDILCGLKYLHKAKIIHRDLKPGNILVNNDCTIQICDFGLARSMDGIFRREAVAEEPELTLNLIAQTSVDSNNSHMLSQKSGGSANKEFEGGKTPKANLRQERISCTRPVLVDFKEAHQLTVINEVSEQQEYLSQQSSLKSVDLQHLSSGPNHSSENKSSLTGNLEEIDIDVNQKSKTGRNEPS